MKKELTVEQKIKRRNFISFGTFFLLGGAGIWSWKWLYHSPIEGEGSITGSARIPLRKALNKTEIAFRNFFSSRHLVKTYPKEMAAKNVRVNSDIGIDDSNFNPETWKLKIIQNPSLNINKKTSQNQSTNQNQTSTQNTPPRTDYTTKPTIELSMEEIKSLPKTEIVFDFKCVEGWDQIQYWGGVTFQDLLKHLGITNQTQYDFVGMETPNEEYYVGLDMDSAIHPQTILAYEMNGKPITLEHGAPLRLIIPVKYGIKNIKRIGTISFSDTRPKDYWAEQGYDYYSGL